MTRVRLLWLTTAAATVLILLTAVRAQERDPERGPLDRPETVRVFTGASNRGDLQQALDGAVARALRSLPGADRMVRYRVREITGEQGGIAGLNVVRVQIEVTDDGDPLPPPRRPLPEEEPVEPLEPDPLRSDLRIIPTQVRTNETVALEIAVRNVSEEPVRLTYPSGQQFEIEVLNGERVVWRWSQGRVFTQAIREVTLNPRQTVTFTARWDLRTNTGARVPPGTYTVRAYLPTQRERRLLESTGTVTVLRR